MFGAGSSNTHISKADASSTSSTVTKVPASSVSNGADG